MNGSGSRGKTRNRLSILTPVFDPPRAAFMACVKSVLEQDYGDWEWCLVDDRSTAPWMDRALRDVASLDQRIKLHRRTSNGGISAASNDALAMAAGDFV